MNSKRPVSASARPRLRMALAFVVALAVMLTGLPLAGFGGGEATAQERKRPNLLDVLRRKPRRVTPPRAIKRSMPRRQKRATKRAARPAKKRVTRRRAAPRKVTRKKAVAAAPVAPVEQVEKVENAKVVLVVGDFLANALADGLETAFAELPGVRVVASSEGASGLVRDDYHDWPETVGALITEHRPAVVVVQLGANDRQPIKTDQGSLSFGTPEWTSAYGERVREFSRKITRSGVPLVWVGAPAFRQRSLSSDMVTFNGLYDDIVEGTGGKFVDLWDGFVDQNGGYVRAGPDVNGEMVRLRAKDGINFTRAGKRKMAFFAEKEVRRLLGGAVSLDIGTLNATNLAPLGDDLLEAPLQPRSTAPIALSDTALDESTVLLGGAEPDMTPAAPTTNPGLLPDPADGPPPDRIDNFAWPPAAEAS